MPCLDQERQFSLTFAHWSVFRNSVKLLYSTGKPRLWICPLPCCGWTMQEHSHQLKERTELTESVRWGKRCVKLGSLQHPPPVGFNTTSELKVQGFCQKLKLPTPQRLQRYPFVILQQPAAISQLICLMHAGVGAGSQVVQENTAKAPSSSLLSSSALFPAVVPWYFYTSKCSTSIF